MPDGSARKPDIRELKQRRARLIDNMRAIMAKAERENRDMTATEFAQHQNEFNEVATMATEIERLERAQDLERLEAGRAGAALAGRGGGADGSFERMCLDFSLRKAILSTVPDLRDAVDAGHEREVSAELVRRSSRPFQGMAIPPQVFWKRVEQRATVTTGAPSLGANLIGVQHMGDQYIDRLRNKLFTARLGATVISDLTGPVDIPKLKQSGVAYWFAENTAITEADPLFATVPLVVKHVGALTSYSRNLLLGSAPAIEDILRDDFARILAEAIDKAVLSGAGGVEPLGLLNQPGLPTLDGTGGSDWSWAVDMISKVEVNSAEAVAWVLNPLRIGMLRKTPKVDGTDSEMIMSGADTLLDRPIAVTNLISPTVAIVGDWSSALIGYFGPLDLLSNPYRSPEYERGSIALRAIQSCDVNFRHVEAFCACTDLPAAGVGATRAPLQPPLAQAPQAPVVEAPPRRTTAPAGAK